MRELFFSLLSGPNPLLAGLAAALAIIIAAFFKGRSNGVKAESLKRVKADLDSKIDQLEMHREATHIERNNAALSEAEARLKAKRVIR